MAIFDANDELTTHSAGIEGAGRARRSYDLDDNDEDYSIADLFEEDQDKVSRREYGAGPRRQHSH